MQQGPQQRVQPLQTMPYQWKQTRQHQSRVCGMEPNMHIYLLAAMRGCHSGCLQHDGQTLLQQAQRQQEQQQSRAALQQPRRQRHSRVLPGMAAGPRRAAGTSRRRSCATSTVTPLMRSCRRSLQSVAPSRGCATSAIPPAPQRCALSRTNTIQVHSSLAGPVLQAPSGQCCMCLWWATGKQGLQTDRSTCCGWPLKVKVCFAGLCVCRL
jgi:hypothetical protein